MGGYVVESIDDFADEAYDKARQEEVDALAFIEEHLEGLIPKQLVGPITGLLWMRRHFHASMVVAGKENFNYAKAHEVFKANVDALHEACCELYKANS